MILTMTIMMTIIWPALYNAKVGEEADEVGKDRLRRRFVERKKDNAFQKKQQ